MGVPDRIFLDAVRFLDFSTMLLHHAEGLLWVETGRYRFPHLPELTHKRHGLTKGALLGT